jgi:hypothetical protein
MFSVGEVTLWWRLWCIAVLAAHYTDSRGWRSTKQAINTQILINGRPVNAKASAGNFPCIAIFLRSMQKPWIPSQWGGNCPPVLKLDNQNIIGRTHIHHTRPRIYHETPPMPLPA